MKKLVSIIAGVILPFMSGCSSPAKLPPNPPPNHESKSILPPTTSQLATRVANYIEKIFPNGLVIDIGKDKKGNNRWISLYTLKENNIRTLEAGSYLLPDSDVQANLKKSLTDKDYKGVLKILKESDIEQILLYDSNINSLDEQDYTITKKAGEAAIKSNITEYLSKSANKLYYSILEKSLSSKP